LCGVTRHPSTPHSFAATLLLLALATAASAQQPVPAQCSGKISAEAGSKLYLKATKDTISWGYFFQNQQPAMAVPSGSEVTVEMVSLRADGGVCLGMGVRGSNKTGWVRRLSPPPVSHHTCLRGPPLSLVVPSLALHTPHTQISHHAGDDPDKLIVGDAAVEEIFGWNKEKMTVAYRGASGQGGWLLNQSLLLSAWPDWRQHRSFTQRPSIHRRCPHHLQTHTTTPGDGVHIMTGPIYVCGAEPGDVLQVGAEGTSGRHIGAVGGCGE
jgi:hypothetical protein